MSTDQRNALVQASGMYTIRDMEVTRLGYGTMQLTGPGYWGYPRDPEEAVRVLQRAVELGVNFIDTADGYGPFVTDYFIKKALHPYADNLIIATKVGITRPSAGQWEPLGRPEYLRQQVELNLRHLGLERIDLLQLHRVDPQVPLADQIGTLARLQEEGKIRHIGMSEVSVDAFIPWFPLATGELAKTGGPLDELSKRLGATPAQLALAWLLKRSANIIPIPGTSSVAHLEQNIASASIGLSEHDFDMLTKAV